MRSRSAARARTTSTKDASRKDPLEPFSPNAPRHLLRTDGFPHVADIMVGSFYDELEEGCAFEELVPRRARRPADQAVHPLAGRLPLPAQPIVERRRCMEC